MPSDHPVCAFLALFPHRSPEFTISPYGAVVPERDGRSPYLNSILSPLWSRYPARRSAPPRRASERSS
ncbi:hypothetical protein ACFPRL_23260 [Pseudoclavibacter helvolus]